MMITTGFGITLTPAALDTLGEIMTGNRYVAHRYDGEWGVKDRITGLQVPGQTWTGRGARAGAMDLARIMNRDAEDMANVDPGDYDPLTGAHLQADAEASDANLTDAQADGHACADCGRDLLTVPSVPVGHGPRGQLFACATHHGADLAEAEARIDQGLAEIGAMLDDMEARAAENAARLAEAEAMLDANAEAEARGLDQDDTAAEAAIRQHLAEAAPAEDTAGVEVEWRPGLDDGNENLRWHMAHAETSSAREMWSRLWEASRRELLC